MYYKRKVFMPSAQHSETGRVHDFSGVTRLIMASLDMGQRVMPLHELLKMYKLTLLYQMGQAKRELSDSEGGLVVRTLRPVLEEILVSEPYQFFFFFFLNINMCDIWTVLFIKNCVTEPYQTRIH
jgi:hypothetical protein